LAIQERSGQYFDFALSKLDADQADCQGAWSKAYGHGISCQAAGPGLQDHDLFTQSGSDKLLTNIPTAHLHPGTEMSILLKIRANNQKAG